MWFEKLNITNLETTVTGVETLHDTIYMLYLEVDMYIK